ncbi:MAG: nitrilase-related carbon-nitrogen hydrolase [Bacteroidota bacterium]
MQDLTLSLLQFDQVWEDKAANRAKITQLTQGLTTDILLLPEMVDTGFSMNTSLAEEWSDANSSLVFLKDLSRRIQASVYTSVMTKTGEGNLNRGVFVTPDGKVEVYDKRKTFKLAGEHHHYLSGKEERIVSFKGWKINLQICFDLRFPELIRNGLVHGKPKYDLLLYVANWPEKRMAHWDALLKARAIENQCYVAGANRVGVDGNGLPYSGNSCVVAMDGSYSFGPCKHEEGIFSCSLEFDQLVNYREKLSFLE